MTPCPFASRCWMAGNYVFCKTAICREPLIERVAAVTGVAEEPPDPLDACIDGIDPDTDLSDHHENGGDCMEPTTMIQSIQGELF